MSLASTDDGTPSARRMDYGVRVFGRAPAAAHPRVTSPTDGAATQDRRALMRRISAGYGAARAQPGRSERAGQPGGHRDTSERVCCLPELRGIAAVRWIEITRGGRSR